MLLKFLYVNWKEELHVYLIEPEKIEMVKSREDDREHWVMHGHVVARDGDPRPEMGDNRRRTFKISEMCGIMEVPRA